MIGNPTKRGQSSDSDSLIPHLDSEWPVRSKALALDSQPARLTRTGGIVTIRIDNTELSDEGCRATHSVTEAANILGISRTTAYECVRTGELPSLRLRGRIVVPVVALQALIAATQR